MNIILPEEYGFQCTQLCPAQTGLPIKLLAFMDADNQNKHPFLLYPQPDDTLCYTTALWPVFLHNPTKEASGFPPICDSTWEKLEKFIECNKDALLAHWALEISSLQLFKQIRPI